MNGNIKKTLFGLHVDSKLTPYIVFGTVVVFWLSSYFVINLVVGKDSGERGQFGDTFGAINALFSGLAFAGIILTILLQREELEAQRMELKETRKEFKTQNTTLKRQRFENTFFNMLSIHFSITKAINANTFKGVDGLEFFINTFAQQIEGQILPKFGDSGFFKRHMECYQGIMASFNSSYSAYLQSIVAIYLSINGYSKDEKIRKRYYDILNSYISQPERTFLFYYILFAEYHSTSQLIRELDSKLRITKDSNINFIRKDHTTFVNDPNRPYMI